ncbi:MAG: hypothetical protein KJO36_06235 [Acidimicrobiia bacterium]|nr:hypothetical protein [Acidimicrobiia bacterium]MBT8250411.1 hypothetical protein [Acidimicrobiia bacterium]NNC44085.1 hypothetical protein [Acidimicrobiia bacterium]NNL28575.1 hypothetical protein [Acidimicrobiia bacterium]
MATNYVLLYKGGAGMDRSEEDANAVMEAWGMWYGKLGDAIVDGGNPFSQSMAMTSDGNTDPSGITGYTVISADDMAGAQALVKDHPHLDDGGTVEVYETFEM